MRPSTRTQILGSLFLLSAAAACNNAAPARLSFDGQSPKRGSSNGEGESGGETLGGGGPDGETGTGGSVPGGEGPLVETALDLSLMSADEHDAYDFTFGLGQIKWESELKGAAIALKRGYLLKKGVILTPEQKALASRLCKDIALSEKKDSLVPAKTDQGSDIFLVWRSHFGADVKLFLGDYLAKNGESLRCAATLSLSLDSKREVATIVFEALADKGDQLVGSAKMESALNEGLLLASQSITELSESSQFEVLSEEAKVVMNVSALNAADVKIEDMALPGAEQCYLIASAGTTKPYNPKSKGGSGMKLVAKSEFNLGAAVPKLIDGRAIKECSAIKFESKNSEIGFRLSCAEYFAIKDQGMEAGCAWDLPLANKLDPENTVALPFALDKFAVKTRDGSRVSAQVSESILPISAINDIRDGKVNLSALSRGQAQLLEDALDLWIALDEKSYRESFFNHIKTIGWDGACTYGAYAQYGSEMVTWCGGGALGENLTARRFQDPNLLMYRAILAWHEVRHTLNFKHDVEDKSYKPCAGTAASASLALALIKNCNFDFCKQIKPSAVSNYKSELNYDYNGDTTGRKSQGDCKAWSTELGVSGEGF